MVIKWELKKLSEQKITDYFLTENFWRGNSHTLPSLLIKAQENNDIPFRERLSSAFFWHYYFFPLQTPDRGRDKFRSQIRKPRSISEIAEDPLTRNSNILKQLLTFQKLMSIDCMGSPQKPIGAVASGANLGRLVEEGTTGRVSP